MMHWIEFNENCARRSVSGQIRRSNDGVRAAWSHTKLIINNLTTPEQPVTSTGELRKCAAAAIADAAPHKLPWMFGVPEPWLPFSVEEANTALDGVGLRYVMYMTAMDCTGGLAAPVRPLPADVEVRRVDSRMREFDALNLNSLAYGMPAAVTEDVLNANTYFSDPEKDYGFVVYNREGVAVSTATAIDLGSCTYIAAVATEAAHRGRGYAEIAIRAALSAAPQQMTALDASRMGEPLYAQMGYQRRFKWNFWTAGG